MSDLIYGPNTEQVTAFIERCKVLTGDEMVSLSTRYAVPPIAIENAWWVAWKAERNLAWETVRDAARTISWSAARAIVVMDLITAEQFAILTEPFAEILAELGIVWKASEASK